MTDAVEIAAKAMNAKIMFANLYGPQATLSDLARAALTAVLDAVTLEWTPRRFGGFDAKSLGGDYMVYERQDGAFMAVGSGLFCDKFPTLAAAQAAALADYRARLARALGMEEG